MDSKTVLPEQKGNKGVIMSILANLRISEYVKDSINRIGWITNLNKVIKSKIGVSVGFVAVVFIVYTIVTIFAIYSLLISL